MFCFVFFFLFLIDYVEDQHLFGGDETLFLNIKSSFHDLEFSLPAC